MIREDLKNTIEKNFGEIEKMERLERSKVFLDLHKELVMIMKREFNIQDPVIDISEITLLDKNVDNGTAKE
jgi:hypothetical protein